MTSELRFSKLVALTVVGAMTLGACQGSETETDNTVDLNPAATTPEVTAPDPVVKLALEDEVGFEKSPGIVWNGTPRHDFENFLNSPEGVVVTRNVMESANGELTVDELRMDHNTYFSLYTDQPVIEGTTYNADMTLWTNNTEPTQVVIQLRNFCTSDNPESSSETVYLTNEPQDFSLSHTFSNAQGCALLRVTNVTKGGATILAEKASLAAN